MLYTCFFVFICTFISCHSSSSKNGEFVQPGDDPNFKIVPHEDPGFTATNRKVVVFGIPIYAYANVEDKKLLHAANILAQYLDNDEDGTVDHQGLLTTLIKNRAVLFMWKTEEQISLNAQDLGADETRPDWHTAKSSTPFDASLEEVWHVITHSGYSKLYPQLSEEVGSDLTNAMDKARGGQFFSIPKTYPSNAWYTYNDKTCKYSCMATEYFYWALTSYLGAHNYREMEIKHEWKLNTREKLSKQDTTIYKLLSDTRYKFPKTLPDGTYKH